MKNKQELCAEAGLPEATFNTWLGKGLLPEPAGVNKRKVLWGDSVVEQIRFIQEQREAGVGLDQIKGMLPAFYCRQLQAMRDEAARLKAWGDPETSKPILAGILGFDLGEAPDIFIGHQNGRYFAWVTAAHGSMVTFAQVDFTEPGNEKVVASKTVAMLDFVALVRAKTLVEAYDGRIFQTHGMSFGVLSAGDYESFMENILELESLYRTKSVLDSTL